MVLGEFQNVPRGFEVGGGERVSGEQKEEQWEEKRKEKKRKVKMECV